MAIDFYELGKRSGAKTPEGQQSGFESLVSSATKPIKDMLATSKAATAALTAAMPAGVPIEKVPEELRGQVTNFLTENKAAYRDATKVLASGINAQSERYKNAVEVINKVNNKFENLSGSLENIALQRQAALDDPSYSDFTTDEDATTFNNLANGSLYTTMTVNEDGSFNYVDAAKKSKAFSDFKINKTGYLGQQGYLSMVESNAKYKSQNRTFIAWEDMKENQSLQLNVLFNKLGVRGSLDYAFSDKQFINDYSKNNNISINDLKKNPGEVVEEYKQYNLLKLEKEYEAAQSFYDPNSGFTKSGLELQAKKRQEKDNFLKLFPSKKVKEAPQEIIKYLNNKTANTRDFAFSGVPGSQVSSLKDENGNDLPIGFYIRKIVIGEDQSEVAKWELIQEGFKLTWPRLENYLNYDLIALN
tara:strand:+ start:367 stop:1617 length:1251 start_codon:yes stop_codon:yes gene_type:complete